MVVKVKLFYCSYRQTLEYQWLNKIRLFLHPIMKGTRLTEALLHSKCWTQSHPEYGYIVRRWRKKERMETA